MYNFDSCPDRRETESVKWDLYPGTLPMWVADMDFEVAPEIREALQKRRSNREFDASKAISEQQLSQLLWAACGVNNTERKLLTIPTAINAQDIKVYVCTAEGTCLYDPYTHSLRLVTKEDIRPLLCERQASMASAPLNLLLVSDQSRFRGHGETYGAMDSGYSSQNICLMCAALGLKTVPRAMMNKEATAKALGLGENMILELNHPIGY